MSRAGFLPWAVNLRLHFPSAVVKVQVLAGQVFLDVRSRRTTTGAKQPELWQAGHTRALLQPLPLEGLVAPLHIYRRAAAKPKDGQALTNTHALPSTIPDHRPPAQHRQIGSRAHLDKYITLI